MNGPMTHSVLDQMFGKRIPGGCDDCDAYQTVELHDGIYHLTVHHDDSCPWLAAREVER